MMISVQDDLIGNVGGYQETLQQSKKKFKTPTCISILRGLGTHSALFLRPFPILTM